MKKGKSKKRKSKRPAKKLVKNTRISFLRKKKNINDMFFDLVDYGTKMIPAKRRIVRKGKNGKKKVSYKIIPDKFIRKGVTSLARELEVSPATLKKYIERGRINEENNILFINVERNFYEISKVYKKEKSHPDFYFKETTKEFTKHNFTFSNFFEMKKIKEVYPPYRFYFRAGLYIVYGSNKGKKTKLANGEISYSENYTIQDYPISHQSDYYKKGFPEFFEMIKKYIAEKPSLIFFTFNYFDVTIIDPASIPNANRIIKTVQKEN